jgi:hypothetical protein
LQLIERRKPSLLERLVSELAKYLLRRAAFTEQVSNLSQRVLLLLLAHLRIPSQFIVVTAWCLRERPGTILARRSR